jgi:hypothetical protein
MRLLSQIVVAGVLACAWTASEAGSRMELVPPEPVAIPASMDKAAVPTAIKRALISRGWSVVQEKPGQVQCTIATNKGHSATVNLNYDAEKVTLQYVDSAHLAYREIDGKQTIHKRYIAWARNLMSDVQKQFNFEEERSRARAAKTP